MSVGALILAAGASARFGSPKQLATFRGETLLDRAVRIALEAGCSPVIVVLGASADAIRSGCLLRGAVVAFNPNWQMGMSTSLAIGLPLLVDTEGVVLMTCDMPAVTAAHLQALAATGQINGSAYAGRTGVPAFFPASAFPELHTLRGDAGARHLLATARAIPLPFGELDIDTPTDLDCARHILS